MPTSQVTLNVPDMSCMHCVKAIKAALAQLPAVRQVDVDLGAKRVDVAYEGPATVVDDLKKSLAAAGYPVAS